MSKASKIKDARDRLLKGIGVPEAEKFIVDDFQKEAIEAVAEGVDTLVVAPTGAGKTYVALQAIEVALGFKSRAVYTTPLKALSNTKFLELKSQFGADHKVGLLTGDRKIDPDSDIVVATTEIYRNELYGGEGRFSVVVLDEVHFIADQQRGPVWEESIILTPKESTLLMLSASISNASEIAAWIEEVRQKECRVVIKKERPVELRFGFLHPELGVLPLDDEDGKVLSEVSRYYSRTTLDPSGMRLRGSFPGKGGGQRKRRPKGGGYKRRGKKRAR